MSSNPSGSNKASDGAENVSPSVVPQRKAVRYVLPLNTIVGGSYQITKPLGHGGMGEVYLARHTKLDIFRAIKILLPRIAAKDPVFATRFMREARLAIQIQHPNIINVMDADYDSNLNIYYIVMEYVDGGTVRNMIRKNGPYQEREALTIIRSVVTALEEAEKRNIVHRDIKPDNIMLTKNNEVKLADLGIAKSVSEHGDTNVTMPEVLIGTPAYVAPEQAKDPQHVDSRADIYSLGVTLYEMLTGEKPYKGKTTLEILEMLFNSPVPDIRQKLPTLSSATAQLVTKMMAKDRAARYKNWSAVSKKISLILDGKHAKGSGTITTTATVSADLKELLAGTSGQSRGGVILTGGEDEGSGLFRRNMKKILSYGIPTVIGFGICLLLMSGVLSWESYLICKEAIIMNLVPAKYKELCQKYNLMPDWDFVLASDAVKDVWIAQNKSSKEPESSSSGPAKLQIKEESGPVPPPPPVSSGGYGTIRFKLEAPDAVKEFLQRKKARLTILEKNKKFAKKIVNTGETLGIPSGKHILLMSLDGCKPYGEYELILKPDEEKTVVLPVFPRDAFLRINCPQNFKVWNGSEYVRKKEIQIPSLQKFELIITADGFQSYHQDFTLDPEEKRSISVELRPMVKRPINSEKMRLAELELERKKYASARRLLEEEGENGNPKALYLLGVLVEEGKGSMLSMFASASQARPYYQRSADLGYPDAIYRMGKYFEADGKYDEAWRNYCRGAEQEHVGCLRKIGMFYQRGLGKVKKDYNRAVSYYKQAASRDDAESFYRIGLLLEEMALDEPRKIVKNNYLQEALVWLGRAENVKYTPKTSEVALDILITQIQDKLNSL